MENFGTKHDKNFFEKEILFDGTVADSSIYFKNKKLWKLVKNILNIWDNPVIFMPLKSAKQPTYEFAYERLQDEIVNEYKRHIYILDNEALLPSEKRLQRFLQPSPLGDGLFTGLNNLDVVSILNEDYTEYFGFTQNEVDDLLNAYGILQRKEEAKSWYDGYLFGNKDVYNPCSVINYVKDIVHKNTEFPKPYWSNTSSNSIVRELIEKADNITKRELENLINSGTIEKPVHEDITYEDIWKSNDNLWNFLFFTGYLKSIKRNFIEQQIFLTLTIPNQEILYIYKNNIMEWFNNKIKMLDFSALYDAIINGDTETIENYLRKQLHESISFMDSAENFYHGFLLGLLSGLQEYERFSNRESGEGRYDIVLKPYDERKPAIILELKRVQRFTEMEDMCKKALQQIDDKHYDAELIYEGYPIIKKYGICFCKKSCMVMLKE